MAKKKKKTSKKKSTTTTNDSNDSNVQKQKQGKNIQDLLFNEAKAPKDHKFWNKQPVIHQDDKLPEKYGPISVRKVEDVRKQPYKLPDSFEWCLCDMTDEKVVDEVYDFLYGHYVEDDDGMFRFDYSRDFLKWALMPPGFIPEWHVGVRFKQTGQLVGFITGIPVDINVHKDTVPSVEINFLCVHKHLRTQRLAPVLIKEITRRVEITDVWQAVYTAGVVIPTPVAQNRYYHRSLNPKKLISIGFSRKPPRTPMTRIIKRYKLDDQPPVPCRPMEEKDTATCHELLTAYLKKQTNLSQKFSLEEFQHWILPRKGVVWSYVVEDKNGKVTDFFSFYKLPSTIIDHPQHKTLHAAYSYYNVSTKTPWQTLMTCALTMARDEGFDVFNALNVMENDKFLEPLKFGKGDGNLQYYLYNWYCDEMKPGKVGIVLL